MEFSCDKEAWTVSTSELSDKKLCDLYCVVDNGRGHVDFGWD